MDAFSTPEIGRIDVAAVYPPTTLSVGLAELVLSFSSSLLDPKEVARLSAEPRQRNSFLLVATLDGQAAGCLKLQHAKAGELFVRFLLTDPRIRNEVARQLFAHARARLIDGEQLVVEVHEDDLLSHLWLQTFGFASEPLDSRTKRQREKCLYEFRSWAPPKKIRHRFAHLFMPS